VVEADEAEVEIEAEDEDKDEDEEEGASEVVEESDEDREELEEELDGGEIEERLVELMLPLLLVEGTSVVVLDGDDTGCEVELLADDARVVLDTDEALALLLLPGDRLDVLDTVVDELGELDEVEDGRVDVVEDDAGLDVDIDVNVAEESDDDDDDGKTVLEDDAEEEETDLVDDDDPALIKKGDNGEKERKKIGFRNNSR
jgi:hypothetical protein